MPIYRRLAGSLCLAALIGTSILTAASAQELADKQIVVVENGVAQTVSTHATTVGQLFKEREISLGKLDRSSVALNTALTDDLQIVITRIRVETVTERTPIPAPTRSVYDPDLRVGVRKVLTPGKPGERAVTYKDTYRDDQRIRRLKLSERTAAPRTEVVKVGLRGMELSSRGSFGPKRVLEMVATGYGPSGNGSWGMRTTTGLRPGFGVVAVDPRIVPLGSRLYIEGYGYAVAGDTGGAIKGMRIDLGFDSDSEAERVGRRRVKVMLLK